MECTKCKERVWVTKTMQKEGKTEEGSSHYVVERGFCFHCGTVYRPTTGNFVLSVHNKNLPEGKGFTILENVDTRDHAFTMLPTYRDLFSVGPDEYLLRITVKSVLGDKVSYTVLHEETVEKKSFEKA